AKWEMIGIEQAQRLGDPRNDEGARRLPGKGAPHIHVPQVEGRCAADDPFGQRLAGTGGRLDADRIEATGNEETGYLRRFAQEVAVVVGKALRSVEEGTDADAAEQWHSPGRRLQDRGHVLKIRRQLVEGE